MTQIAQEQQQEQWQAAAERVGTKLGSFLPGLPAGRHRDGEPIGAAPPRNRAHRLPGGRVWQRTRHTAWVSETPRAGGTVQPVHCTAGSASSRYELSVRVSGDGPATGSASASASATAASAGIAHP